MAPAPKTPAPAPIVPDAPIPPEAPVVPEAPALTSPGNAVVSNPGDVGTSVVRDAVVIEYPDGSKRYDY